MANIGSLTYKNYKPVEIEDGKTIYVSPEDENKILLANKLSQSRELVFENERNLNRRNSRSSDSSYETPVQSKPVPAFIEELKPEDSEECARQVLPTQIEVRHSFPFHGRKHRLFPETSESKKMAGEVPEEFLKLPPHIEQIKEEDANGDGRRKHFKFPHLFRKSKSNRGSKDKGEEIAKAMSDNEPSIVEVNVENRELVEGVPDRSDMSSDREECVVKSKSIGGKGDPEENGKPKHRESVTFKTIFGIDKDYEARVRKDPVMRDVEENGVKEVKERAKEEGSGEGFEGAGESKRASLNFPINMPPRGQWGPKSRRQETKSAPEMHINNGEDSKPSKKIKKKKSVPFFGESTQLDLRSDTESADHGSTDKSSVSKLTEEKHQKRLFDQFLASIKRKNKDKVSDNEALRNLSVTIDKDLEQQIQRDQFQKDHMKTDGIVYAELDMTRSPGNLVRRDDEKTEYAEIIHPKANDFQRGRDELRKSRENLAGSREHLTEDEGTTLTPDGKKEAAV